VTLSIQTHAGLPRPGLAVGALAQFAVLGTITVGVGLGVVGWLAGTVYAVVVWATLSHALRRSGQRSLGPANVVTLTRSTLVGGITALVADAVAGHRTPTAALVVLTTVALILDAVDGQVARRTGTTTALGARFDMETDAFLILVLSAFVALELGWWVLAIGVFRYAFVAASWRLPWLRASLPPRFSRKTVAVVQAVVLVVASSGLLPTIVNAVAVGLALAMLTWSFVRDSHWLWRHRQPVSATSG